MLAFALLEMTGMAPAALLTLQNRSAVFGSLVGSIPTTFRQLTVDKQLLCFRQSASLNRKCIRHAIWPM
jgi:hypothetical protein